MTDPVKPVGREGPGATNGPVNRKTLDDLLQQQKNFARMVRHSDSDVRTKKLHRLQQALLERRTALQEAMWRDFGKAPEEVDLTEVIPVILEVRHAVRHLGTWMRPRKVRMPLPLLGTASEVHFDPKGVVLIISPWNYPVTLTLGPLVSAVAAGNCAILKPSELAPHTSAFIADLIGETFDPREVTVVTGDHRAAEALLELPFDHVFFTGSPRVGKIVMKAAAENLSSVTLELGGKSPAVVTATADLESAAHAIAWGKFTNAGQTCVAPDFVLADVGIADGLNAALKEALENMEGDRHERNSTAAGHSSATGGSTDLARIVNERHFDRINALITGAVNGGARVVTGGSRNRETRYIQPTVITELPAETAIMSEEIFGPVLPLLTYGDLDEAIAFVNRFDPPLALYIFSADSETSDRILADTRSGGVVINDVGIHFANPNLPFGGVRTSGIGRSHGHAGFLAFSNERSVMRQRFKKPPTRAFYPPYNETTRRLIDWFLRFVG